MRMATILSCGVVGGLTTEIVDATGSVVVKGQNHAAQAIQHAGGKGNATQCLIDFRVKAAADYR